MVARLSVGTRYAEPLLVILGLLTAGAAAAAGYLATRPSPDPVLVNGAYQVAAAAAAALLLRWYLVARGRRWLSPTRTGFVVEDRRGTFAIDDDDVAGLATESAVRYDSGVPKGTVHRGALVLWDGGRVSFRYEFPRDGVDPLRPFFDRLLAHLVERGAADTVAGDAVRGKRWELTADWLSAGGRQLAAADIAAAGLADGQVCVWQRGEPLPAVRVPAGSVNALVLLELLGRRTAAAGGDPDDAVGGFGRILFERGAWANPRGLLIVSVLFGTVFGGLGALEKGIYGAAVAVGIFLAIESPLLLAALVSAGNVFRCHARGVYRRVGWWSRELRFEDIARFAYSATRHYYNGAYMGTAVKMRFTPRPGSGLRTVRYLASVKNADDELENLREHVSRVVAGHLLRRLERGQSVGWTDGLRLRTDGLEWTARGGLFRRPMTRVVPYHEIEATGIQEGHFYLWLRGGRKYAYTTPVSADNFFPGLALLEMVRYRPAAPAARPAEVVRTA